MYNCPKYHSSFPHTCCTSIHNKLKIEYSGVSVLNKATGWKPDWHIDRTETENLIIVNKAENEEREVQDVIYEVDELYDPLLDDLNMDILMEDNMDSKSISKN